MATPFSGQDVISRYYFYFGCSPLFMTLFHSPFIGSSIYPVSHGLLVVETQGGGKPQMSGILGNLKKLAFKMKVKAGETEHY